MAPDGVPSEFLRRNGWQVLVSTPYSFTLSEASGLDNALLAQLLRFDFPLSCKIYESVIVGKWQEDLGQARGNKGMSS
ncbi:hypothetical protein J1N35_043817 [Gossypium stocksii]|uniref:Uncharacterized protein n=1 Tax=Gossypium stocksii TaxID=47602 RepID=A0A9D3ZFU3_9ROSI|nr:hypothetical protein J1N35_043817 [Gossypium stocksii]